MSTSISQRVSEPLHNPPKLLESALGQTRSFGFVGSMSGLPESGHGWAIYEPLLVVVILTDKLRMHRPLRRRGAGLDSIVLPVRIFPSARATQSGARGLVRPTRRRPRRRVRTGGIGWGRRVHGAAQPVAAVSSGRVPTAATVRPKSLSKAVGNGCDAVAEDAGGEASRRCGSR